MEETKTILDGGENENPDDGVVNNPVVTDDGGNPAPQQTPPAEYDYSKMIVGHGGFADNWRDGLPESIRNEKCLDSIKTVGALAQSYVHAQKSIGANKVALPGENATQEELDEFYKALGRPDKAEDYASDKIELPEGVTLDTDEVKKFRDFAFEHGISQKVFEAALKFDIERVQNQIAAENARANAEYEETLGKLQSEFGGRADAVVAQCNKAMQTFGLTEVLRDHGLLNNYTVVKALAGIGERISESRLHGEAGTPVDPQTRINEIMGNPKDPYYDREHPNHAARVAEVRRLENRRK